MTLLINELVAYLTSEYERLFPDQANYTPVVRQAIYARLRRADAVLQFYDTHGPDGSLDAAGNMNPRPKRIVEMCERAFRDVIKSEFSNMSDTSSFMLRNFIRMNRQKTSELVANVLQSDAVCALTDRYRFLIPLLVEASNPEWLSSQLGL